MLHLLRHFQDYSCTASVYLFPEVAKLFFFLIVPSLCFNSTKPHPDRFKGGLVEQFNGPYIKSVQKRSVFPTTN